LMITPSQSKIAPRLPLIRGVFMTHDADLSSRDKSPASTGP
jgi:hypothetical protein